MKNKIVNLISTILFVVSLFLIARHFVITAKNRNNEPEPPAYMVDEDYPTTEIESSELDIDLGEVEIGKTISQKYVMRNSGDQPLVVMAINPDCNCTDFKISKWKADPRDSVVVSLFVNTADKKAGETELTTVMKVNTEERFYLLTLRCELVERRIKRR